MIEIITGRTGKPHIGSADDRMRNACLFGKGDYVLDSGQKFKHTVESANLINIADGDAMIQGTHVRIRYGGGHRVNLPNGTTGYKMNLIIGILYSKIDDTEKATIEVYKGNATTGSATDPSYPKEDILKSGTKRVLPLYRVRLNGVNIEKVEPMFEVTPNLHDYVTISKSTVDAYKSIGMK